MKAIQCSRGLVGVLIIAVSLLAVGCTADGQQTRDDVTGGGSPPSEAEVSPDMMAAVECLRDRGWEIVIDSEEGWSAPGVSEAQSGAYFADTDECTRLNTTIEPLEEISEERWESAYVRQTEFSQCLRDLGYDVPSIPSFQAWRDSFFVGEDAASQWTPWNFVPVESMSGDEFRALEAACPQPAGP